MFKIICTICICLFALGCFPKQLPEYTIPQGCINEEGEQKPSLILEYIDYPRETALLLKLDVMALIKQDKVTHDEVLAFIEDVKEFVDTDLYYSSLFEYVQKEIIELNKEAGVSLVLISQYFNDFRHLDTPIYECDKILIKKHLREQETMVLLSK
ncbi:MAG: hypothetical protein ACOCQD_00610 [archaeon]